ncbi:hypothetical protein BC938DRAFT_482843, partial [Jimgerdemannia flammicorona]
FLSSYFFIRIILVVYVGAGFYASVGLQDFDIPMKYDQLSGVVKIARAMLQTKNPITNTPLSWYISMKKILHTTITRYEQIKARAEKEKFAPGRVRVIDRPKEFVTPKRRQTHKLSAVVAVVTWHFWSTTRLRIKKDLGDEDVTRYVVGLVSYRSADTRRRASTMTPWALIECIAVQAAEESHVNCQR